MSTKEFYIERLLAKSFIGDLQKSLTEAENFPVLFQIWGIGGIGKTTLLGKAKEIFTNVAIASIYFGRTEGVETPIKLMKTLHNQLKLQFPTPPLFQRGIRELKPKPDPFSIMYNQYFDTIQQLEDGSLDGKESASAEQLKLVQQLIEQGASAVSWGATATGHLEIAGIANLAGNTVGEVTNAARSVLSVKDEFGQLLRKHHATKHKRELQELVLEPIPKLTQAFVKTLSQWSNKKPIILIIDTYEMAPPVVDNWLCKSLLGNNIHLRKHPVRLVIAGRYQLTKSKNWQRLQQDYDNLLNEKKITCFDHKETSQYLEKLGITNTRQVRTIYKRTNGLPYHLDKIREKYKNEASLSELQDIQEIADFLLSDLSINEKKLVNWATCARWFDQSLIKNLVAKLKLETDKQFDWFDWLCKRHFVERVQNHYRIQDVARDVIREKLHQDNKPELKQIHCWLAEYFENLVKAEFIDETNPPDLYGEKDWREATVEFLYHALLGRRADAQVQFLNHLFSGVYLNQIEVVEIPLRAIMAEGQLSKRSILSAKTLRFLYDISPIIIPCQIIETDKALILTLVSSEEAWKAGLKYIGHLKGLAKFSACLRKADICLPKKRIEWLQKAKIEAEIISETADPKFSSSLFELSLGLGNFALENYEEAIACFDKAIELNPDSYTAWHNRGDSLSRLKLYQDAVDSFDQALEINPSSISTWNSRGLDLNHLGRNEEALASLDKAIELDPNDFSAWTNRGSILDDLERYEEAILNFDKAIDLYPDNHVAWNNRGNSLTDLGQRDKAIASYDKALEIKADKPDYWFCKGNAFSHFKEYKEAISNYDQSLKLKSDSYETWYMRSQALIALGNHQAAFVSFKKLLEKEPGNQEIWYWWSNVLNNLQNYEEAISWSKKLTQEKPSSYEAWYQLGKLFTSYGQYEKAINSHRKALDINPLKPEIWNNLAHAHSMLEHWELMLTSCNKAIKLQPNFAGALYNQGIALTNLRRLEEALESYDKAIEVEPDYYDAWFNRSSVLSRLGRKREAIESYRKSTQVKSDDYELWLNRSGILFELGQYNKALKEIKTSLSLHPECYKSLSLKGAILATLNRFSEAVSCYQKVVQLRPNDEEIWYLYGLSLTRINQYNQAVQVFTKALEIQPEHYKSLCEQARCFKSLGQYDKAIKNYDLALAIQPDDYEVWHYRGSVFSSLGQYQEAMNNFNQALKIKPDDYLLLFAKSSLLAHLGKYDAALALSDKALKINQDFCEAWYERAIIFLELKQYNKALQSLNKALEINSKFVQALQLKKKLKNNPEKVLKELKKVKNNQSDYKNLLAQGFALHSNGLYNEALQFCDRVLKNNAKCHEALVLKVIILGELQQYAEMLEICNFILELKYPHADLTWYYRAIALRRLGRTEEALSSFDKVIKINPDSFYVYSDRGLVLSEDLGRHEEAIQSYDIAIEAATNSEIISSYQLNETTSVIWLNRGNALLHLGRSQEALDSFERSLKLDPGYVKAWAMKGAALITLNDYEKAIKNFDKALELQPDFYEAQCNKGNALLFLKRYEEAISSYQEIIDNQPELYSEISEGHLQALIALEKYEEVITICGEAIGESPENYGAWNLRGIGLCKLGQYEKAIESYDKAIEINENASAAYYNKACCYAIQENSQQAIQQLKKAIEFDSQYREMAKTESEFESLRESYQFKTLLHQSNTIPI